MINYSLTPARRIEMEFQVLSENDLSTIHAVTMEAVSKIEYIYPGKAVEIYFNDIRFDIIKLTVWFWIDNHLPPGYMAARHDAIFYILTAYKAKGISLASVPVLDSREIQS